MKATTLYKSTLVGALALAALMTSAAAQTQGSPGTAGAGNAAAASPGGTPTMQGIGPGTTSPGGSNSVQEAQPPAPPAANPNQVPNSGPVVNSTVPPRAPATAASGGSRINSATVGNSASTRSQKDADKALNDSVNKKVMDICKGC